jgi:hypothetical protein
MKRILILYILLYSASPIISQEFATSFRTEYKHDASQQGSKSGFFETYTPVNYPTGASNWWHLLDIRHTNPDNNYAMQFAGSFFDQDLYFRKINNNSSQSWSKILMTDLNGNVGIGTTTPAAKISFGSEVNEQPVGIAWSDVGPLVYGIHKTAGAWHAPNYQQLRLGWQTGIILDPGQGFGKSYVDIQGSGLRVSSGSVGIGISNPPSGYKLAVAGNIIAEQVRVQLQSSGWPDYVFKPQYKLMPLSQVEDFIKEKGHLPEVPRAEEVAKEGVELGTNQALLLKKIEELTLHLIEMEKRNNEQDREIERLKKKIQSK